MAKDRLKRETTHKFYLQTSLSFVRAYRLRDVVKLGMCKRKGLIRRSNQGEKLQGSDRSKRSGVGREMYEGLAGADPAQSMTGGKAGVPCDGWGQRSMYASGGRPGRFFCAVFH